MAGTRSGVVESLKWRAVLAGQHRAGTAKDQGLGQDGARASEPC